METKTVSVIGTGDFGCAITKRLIRNGKHVFVGSRNPQKRNLSSRDAALASAKLVSTRDCIMASEIIVIAVSFQHIETLKMHEEIVRGKILIDVSNPAKVTNEKSNAEKLAELLPSATVVKCFNTVSAYAMGSDASNEHRQVQICSDESTAAELVTQLARDMGFAVNNAGALRNAREIEAIPLYLFRGWGWPTIFTIGLFIIEMVYLYVAMYALVDRYDISMIPTYMLYKASGAVCVNLLAFCYLPGILAAFVQIYNGSKHTRFQQWLDKWLQGRKQLGLYALLFAFIHMIAVMSCMNGSYFGYLFKTPSATVSWNATADTKIAVDSKMNLHGEGCIISGLIAITAMSIIGLTSVPAIGSLLNWREWRFIQSHFGFVCFLLTVGHCMVHGVARWTVQRDLALRNSFMSLQLPWLTIVLKIIYFIPCVHIYVWKIRGGYERGVQYDTEKGEPITSTANGYSPSSGLNAVTGLTTANGLNAINSLTTINGLKTSHSVTSNENAANITIKESNCSHGHTNEGFDAGKGNTKDSTPIKENGYTNGYTNGGFTLVKVSPDHETMAMGNGRSTVSTNGFLSKTKGSLDDAAANKLVNIDTHM